MKEEEMHHTPSIRGMVIALALVLSSSVWLVAQNNPGQSQVSGAPQGMPDLVAGLKATPGCLGVELARTQSGKQAIFAWFENKQAALKWYYSTTHQTAMHMLT